MAGGVPRAGSRLERSVIQVGDSALAVTLPSWWARLHGLKPRSRVEVEVLADGSLKVTPRRAAGAQQLSRTIRLHEGRARGSIVREVVAAYLAGFSRIRLEYPAAVAGEVRMLRGVLEEVMLGLTLVEEGSGYMEFYVTVDPRAIGFWEAVERAYKVTLSMLRDALDAASAGDLARLESIPERDSIVDKLYLYANRKANMVLLGLEPFQTLGITSLAEIPSILMAAKSIERVADHTVLISRNASRIIRRGEGVPEGVLGLCREALSAFEVSGKALLGRSRKAAEDVAVVIDKYQLRGRDAGAGGPGPLEAVLIADSARRILGYSLDIAEAVIDLESVREAAGVSSQG